MFTFFKYKELKNCVTFEKCSEKRLNTGTLSCADKDNICQGMMASERIMRERKNFRVGLVGSSGSFSIVNREFFLFGWLNFNFMRQLLRSKSRSVISKANRFFRDHPNPSERRGGVCTTIGWWPMSEVVVFFSMLIFTWFVLGIFVHKGVFSN